MWCWPSLSGMTPLNPQGYGHRNLFGNHNLVNELVQQRLHLLVGRQVMPARVSDLLGDLDIDPGNLQNRLQPDFLGCDHIGQIGIPKSLKEAI